MSVRTYLTEHDACSDTGKRVYVTQARAHAFAKVVGRKNRKSGDSHPAHVFRRESCGHYHIGHDPGWLKRRRNVQKARECAALALRGAPLSADEIAEYNGLRAAEMARAEARRSRSPQMELV